MVIKEGEKHLGEGKIRFRRSGKIFEKTREFTAGSQSLEVPLISLIVAYT